MNISTLEQYVDGINRWGKLFGNAPLSLLNAKDRQRIADRIDSDLSPENLTCDGELPRAEVNRRYQMLTRCQSELMAIDPAVNFYDFN